MRRMLTGMLMVGVVVVAGACSTSDNTAADKPADTTTTSVDTEDASTDVTSTYTRSSDAEFLAAGNAICAEMNASIAAIAESDGSAAAADVSVRLEQTVEITATALAELRALPQPAGEGEQLTKLYADVEDLASLISQMGAAYVAGDQVELAEIQAAGQSLSQQVNADYIAFGLDTCGTPA